MVHLTDDFNMFINKIYIAFTQALNKTEFKLYVWSINQIIKYNTLRAMLNVSPMNGSGAGPGIPRRRNILLVRRSVD